MEAIEPIVEKYAQDWPAWGHRKIYALMRAGGHDVSASTVERAMRRRNLLQPVEYHRQRRELARARKAAFANPPTVPNQVWQLDFSEFETTTDGVAHRRMRGLLLEVRVRLAPGHHVQRR
ncbi:IS3 family transposase [Saccharopolyspora shandongensis]|uniref:IS3 family transposase n=1 Tax=Saccharopolyspora shandongensis TaxID=418495 RepID=UPI00341477B1